MTDEQINIAIAESLGWTEISDWKAAGINGLHPSGQWTEVIPNYTIDLNACHEFEKTLTPSQLRRYANDSLYTVVIEADADRSCAMNFALTTCASARQRCEAYLRTIGKWIE